MTYHSFFYILYSYEGRSGHVPVLAKRLIVKKYIHLRTVLTYTFLVLFEHLF